jgi:hypothetical protein
MMPRAGVLVLALIVAACEEVVAPEPPPLELEIIAPSAADSLFDGDSVLLVGDARAPDLGPLPDDSLWWTDNGLELGRGRAVKVLLVGAPHLLGWHARYGARSDSVSELLRVVGSGIGRLLWTVPLDSSYVDGASLSPSGVLYALERGGERLVAISGDGNVLWRADLGAYVYGHPPAIGLDGTIYYGIVYSDDGARGGVVAMAPDGTRKWVFATNDYGPPGNWYYHVHGGIAVGADGTVYFVSEERDAPMYAVAPNGRLKWRTSTRPDGGTRFWTHVTLVGESLAVAVQRNDSVVAVATGDGAVRWKSSLPGFSFDQHTAAVGVDGTVYICKGTTLLAVRPDGREAWRRTIPFAGPGSPAIAGTRLFLAMSSGGALVYSLAGDSVGSIGRAEGSVTGTVAVGANGVIYIAGADTLFSYGADGVLRFRTPISRGLYFAADPGPVIGPDGTLYYRGFTALAAIRDTVGPAVGEVWPGFQGGPTRSGRRAP